MDVGVGSGNTCKDLERWSKILPRTDDSSEAKLLFTEIDGYHSACALPADDLTAEQAKTTLGDAPLHASLEGDTLTLFANTALNAPPAMCCTLWNFNWAKLGKDGLWGARTRLAEADKALIKLAIFDTAKGEMSEFIHLRGPNAPAEALFITDTEQELEGTMIETTLASPELGETRRLIIYLPPNHKPDETTATLIMADGDSARYYARMIDPMIKAGLIRPLALIGVPSGASGIVDPPEELTKYDVRSLDYLPEYDKIHTPEIIATHPNRFEKHMAFVTETLLTWVRTEYGLSSNRLDTGFTGQSNGGVVSLYAGYLHPEIFGISIPISPGWRNQALTELASAKGDKSKFFIAAGLYEPSFLASARASAAGLKAAGYDVTTTWNAAGHSPDQTEAMLFKYLPLAFPPSP